MTHDRSIVRTIAVGALLATLLVQGGAQAQNSGENSGQAAPVQKAAAPKPKIRRVSAPAVAAPATPAPKVTKRAKATKAKAKTKRTTTQPPVVADTPAVTYCAGVPSTALGGVWPAGVLTFEPDTNWLCGFADTTESKYVVVANRQTAQYTGWNLTPDVQSLQLGKHAIMYRQSDGLFRLQVMTLGGYYVDVFASSAAEATNIATVFVSSMPPSSVERQLALSIGECPAPRGPITAKSVAPIFGMTAVQMVFATTLQNGTASSVCNIRGESGEFDVDVLNNSLSTDKFSNGSVARAGWVASLDVPNSLEANYPNIGIFSIMISHPSQGLLVVNGNYVVPNKPYNGMRSLRTYEQQRPRTIELAKRLLAL